MTATVTKLPTASSSYYEFKAIKGGWQVDLVTPSPGKALRTALAWGGDRDEILKRAQDYAARTQRPLKVRKGA